MKHFLCRKLSRGRVEATPCWLNPGAIFTKILAHIFTNFRFFNGSLFYEIVELNEKVGSFQQIQ